MKKPSGDFVRFFLSKVHEGKKTKKRIGEFADITKKAFDEFVDEVMNERVKHSVPPSGGVQVIDTTRVGRKSKIVTTIEELEGFYIVRTILRGVVKNPQRISYKDTASHFGILLDDDRRQPICRLYFDRPKKYIGLFDDKKAETREQIELLDDICKHSAKLKKTVSFYEGKRG